MAIEIWNRSLKLFDPSPRTSRMRSFCFNWIHPSSTFAFRSCKRARICRRNVWWVKEKRHPKLPKLCYFCCFHIFHFLNIHCDLPQKKADWYWLPHFSLANLWHFCSSQRSPEPSQELIDIMDRLKIPQERRPKICPKIEKPQAWRCAIWSFDCLFFLVTEKKHIEESWVSMLQALSNIDGIIAKSQALMVARGDLGVELELERVPFAQKLLIRKAKARQKPCNFEGGCRCLWSAIRFGQNFGTWPVGPVQDAGLFVINATQMVESMWLIAWQFWFQSWGIFMDGLPDYPLIIN